MAKTLLDYDIEYLYEWISDGQRSDVPKEFEEYVLMLNKINGMMQRPHVYGTRDAIIKHLVNFEPVFKNNRLKAIQFYNESFEYFNADQDISVEAWRNFYANKADQDYEMARAISENASDFEKASKIAERAYKFRGLDRDTPEKLPDSLFAKPNKLYTWDMNQFEIGSVDRTEALEWIEEHGKKLSPIALERIKQEMLVPKHKIKLFLDDAENPRKS